MPDISDTVIENIQDLLCNLKEAMKDVFMPRDELNTTYAAKNHTHPVDSSLSGSSTNPVQNKVIKTKTDSIETALDGKSNVGHDHSDASASVHGFLSTSLYTKLDGIETQATKNVAATSNPLMDGTAAVGSSSKYAKEDHVHPTDTSRAPTSHASSATTYGVSSTSNYGHAMTTGTTPKPLAASASIGSETAKFARGDHVHPLPSTATSSTAGLMSANDKSKLDGISPGATTNNRRVTFTILTPTDEDNGPLVNVTQGSWLKVRMYEENTTILPSNLKFSYVINGTEYERTHNTNQTINLPAGAYHVHIVFKGSGVYAQAYRSFLLKVTA